MEPCLVGQGRTSVATSRHLLLLVCLTLFGGNRCERAEQAIGLIVRTGGEEQRAGWTSAAIVAETQCPESVDLQGGAVRVQHVAEEAASDRVEGSDRVTAEVTDEDGVAELTEAGRRPDHAPGSVEPVAMLQTLQQVAVTIEDVDEAVTGIAGLDGIVLGRILLGVGDVDVRPDSLDVKR